jgi:hypothetical protein
MFAHPGRAKRIADFVVSVDEKTDKHSERMIATELRILRAGIRQKDGMTVNGFHRPPEMGTESVNDNSETEFVPSKLNLIAFGRAGHVLQVSSRNDFLDPGILDPGTAESEEMGREVHGVDERKPRHAFDRDERLAPREGGDSILQRDLA